MALEGDTLATARVKLIADARGMPDQVKNQTEKQLGDAGEKAGSAFGKRMVLAIGAAVAVGAAVVTKKLVSGLKESVKEASDLNEVTSKVGVVFGKNAKDIEKFAANSAKSLGQSKKATLDAAATFAIYGKGAKLTGKDLVGFSSKLVTLSSDMASFSNTSPEEAVAALGSALRGEFDPIERYGVLLNQTAVDAEAVNLGLVKTTKNAGKIRAAQLTVNVAQERYNKAVRDNGKDSIAAQSAEASLIRSKSALGKAAEGSTEKLTAQQRVLAVQSLILKQTSDAQGDFARTSAGLANQQRIASAQVTNLKAKIGASLLPTMVKLTQVFNTQVIPALNELWTKHGPAVTRVIEAIGVKLAAFVSSLAAGDFSGKFDQLRDTFDRLKASAGPALSELLAAVKPAGESLKRDLIPALRDLREDGGQGLSDAINVGAIALRFLADHADLLAKALPYLVGSMVAFKVAQLASNVAMAASPFLRVAEIVATRQQTAAIVANTAAKGAERGATIAGTTATAASTAAQNLGTLARIRATVSTYAHAAATNIANIATKIWTVTTLALGVAMKVALGPIGIVITIVAALVAVIIYAYKHNETFRKIVDAVWKAIKTAIKATVDWFKDVAWPALKKAFDALMAANRFILKVAKEVWGLISSYIKFQINNIVTAFNLVKYYVTVVIPNAFRTVKNVAETVWGAIRAYIGAQVNLVVGFFTRLKDFITVTLPSAFRTGVNAIRTAWAAVQDAAKKPVAFVVNQVINPLIGGYNAIAKVFHAPTAAKITGFAEGGRIPGHSSDTDNRIAGVFAGGGHVGNIRVATGEFIVNARSTAANLPLIKAVNNAKGALFPGKQFGVETAYDGLEGFAEGGFVDKLGGFFGKVKKGITGVAGFVADPAAGLKKLFDAAMGSVPGGGPIVEVLKGMGAKVYEGIKSFLTGGLFNPVGGNFGPGPGFGAWPSSPSAQRGDSGVWRSVVAMLKRTGPLSGSFGNGYRPGDPKWHGSGRAVDWMGYNQDALATYLTRVRPLELIHRTNKRDYAYTRGRNRGSFNNALMQAHRNHIHIAMRDGGMLEYSNNNLIKKYDTGGRWPSGTLGVNTSGQDEHVTTGANHDRQTSLLERIAELLELLAPAIGGEVGRSLMGTVPATRVAARQAGRRPTRAALG